MTEGPDVAEGDKPTGGPSYTRSRQRADETRASLTPLGPGERPLGLKLAVALAVAVALANLIGVIASAGDASPTLGIAFAVVMLAAAAGMWERSYLTLLAFQALLAVGIIYAALSLAFASNLLAVVTGVAVIAICSPIFWLLVRVMARLQVPRE
jgi:hypothetical protein